ncbi:hypothetical protein ACI6Q2_12640 [Chitinophagaceae bacterium LWZ2-11]
MATDGIKIIDGDLARDTYNEIMDLYDSDASIEIISKNAPFIKTDLGGDTDFYHEIFVTAYALAFWEIGALTDDILNEVKRVIALKAGVKVWGEGDKELGIKRQKELDKLLKKISQTNTKIRIRKKYRQISNLYFQANDVLTFQLSDNNYYAIVCAKVTQYRGQCTYDFVATTYKGITKPSIDDLKKCFIAGRRIGSGYDLKTTLSLQPHVNEIWGYYQKDTNFFFGLSYCLVTHKDIILFKDKFEVIGKLKIKESFKQQGGYGYESSFERFEKIFSDLDKHMQIFGEEKFPVSLLCEL